MFCEAGGKGDTRLSGSGGENKIRWTVCTQPGIIATERHYDSGL